MGKPRAGAPPSGHYPIERRAGEIERLRIQAAAMAFDAGVMLDRIDVQRGWCCLDLGCGAGGILELLGARVGATGFAVGFDADLAMLRAARSWVAGQGISNVALVAGDACGSPFRLESFDLVHVRFVASTTGLGERLLREALSLVRPGGVLAFQEPDTDALNCFPPHPAWERLKKALQDGFASVGGDTRLAKSLYGLIRRVGLEDVRYRPFLVGVTASDPMAEYLPATIESIRGTLLSKGLISEAELDAALVACRAHLAHPDTVSTSYLVAQVWGRKPAGMEPGPRSHAPACS